MQLPVRLFASMNFRVILKMRSLIKGRTTDITPVWLLAGVNSSMIP